MSKIFLEDEFVLLPILAKKKKKEYNVKKQKKHVKWFYCSLLLTVTLLYRLLLITICLTQLMHNENHRSNFSLWSDISG